MNQMAPAAVDRKAAAAGVAARLRATTKIIPTRIMTDPLMTYAYAGDSSQYRLVPAIVVIVNSEAEVLAVLNAARAERTRIAPSRPSPPSCPTASRRGSRSPSPCWWRPSSRWSWGSWS